MDFVAPWLWLMELYRVRSVPLEMPHMPLVQAKSQTRDFFCMRGNLVLWIMPVYQRFCSYVVKFQVDDEFSFLYLNLVRAILLITSQAIGGFLWVTVDESLEAG